MKKSNSLIGIYFDVPAGATVYRHGQQTTQSRNTTICVRRQDKTAQGATRIYWKSHGYIANTEI